MSGWQAGLVTRTLFRILPYAATALLIGYVGGPALAVFVVSIVLTAIALQRWEQFRGSVGVLGALVTNLAWLMIYLGVILRVLLRVPGLRRVVVEPLTQTGFHPISFPATSVSFFWVGSLLVLAAPGVISAAVLLRTRARDGLVVYPVLSRWLWIATLLPFALIAILKWVDPWRALAFVMSGDGRNHFLIVEEIRATSGAFPNPLDLSAPRLSNAIASLLSSGNGASGTMQTGDLWGMLSVYVFSAAMLIAATLAGFAKNGRGRERSAWIGIPLAIGALLLATNSFVLSTSLHDGFMSLYFGTAVLATALVLAAVLPVGAGKVVMLFLALIAETGAYSFLAPIVGVVLAIESLRWLWVATPTHRRRTAVPVAAAIAAFASAAVVRSRWHSFEITAAFPGSVTAIDSGVLWVLLCFAITLWLAGERPTRASGLTGVLAVGSGLVLLYLIERVPANAGSGYSYYGSKIIVGAAGAALCLAFVPLGPILASTEPRRLGRLVTSAGLFGAALIPFAIAEEASPLARPWSDIRNGWVYPDAGSIQHVVGRWGDDPYLFFRFADDPPLVRYPSVYDDRLLNFWTPTFWDDDIGTEWYPMWGWAYSEMTSPAALPEGTPPEAGAPAVLCAPISLGVRTIYTRDPALEAQVDAACGPNDAKFVVFPRATQP